MRDLFLALEARFKADAALKLSARKMYQGFRGEPIKTVLPYVEVHLLDGSDDDSFSIDFKSCLLQFSFFTKREQQDEANEIMGHLERVFKAPKLVSGAFDVVEFRLVGQNGPEVIENKYQGTLRYQVLLQLKTRTADFLLGNPAP